VFNSCSVYHFTSIYKAVVSAVGLSVLRNALALFYCIVFAKNMTMNLPAGRMDDFQ